MPLQEFKTLRMGSPGARRLPPQLNLYPYHGLLDARGQSQRLSLSHHCKAASRFEEARLQRHGPVSDVAAV